MPVGLIRRLVIPLEMNSQKTRQTLTVIEVLSDSTEAFDRGDKFADYQTLDSPDDRLRQYGDFRQNVVALT